MNAFEKTSPTVATPAELFAWHSRPGAFTRLMPPWQSICLPGGEPEVRDGSQVEIKMRRGPLSLSWLAEHRNVLDGKSFEDFQVRGPFASWEHSHEFLPGAEGGSLLSDRIRYRLRGGSLAEALVGSGVRKDLGRAFDYRHRTTTEDLRLHQLYADRPRLSVAISGATGLIGQALAALLSTGGHRVVRLARGDSSSENANAVAWHPERGVAEPDLLEGLDAVVHLAGENIGSGRWTRAKRQRISDSRIEGTRRLIGSLRTLERPPRAFLCASAIGFYGDRAQETMDESGDRGNGFLAAVCEEWERVAAGAAELGSRVANLRFGVVTSPLGGFLPRMLPPFRAGLGGVVGSGEQFVSWISLDDAISAVLHVLMGDGIEGPVNVCAPNPVTNRELTRTLGRALRRPTIAPLPAPAARLAFGQMAEETLLASTRARPARLIETGYTFRHPTLESALLHQLGK
jgi:uncharacterized protein (TIGR01777 family)